MVQVSFESSLEDDKPKENRWRVDESIDDISARAFYETGG